MKNILKLEKVFTPSYYRWIILPVSVVVMILLGSFMTAGLGELGFVIAVFLDTEVLLFSDMVVFNGVSTKNTKYKLLMSSSNGRDVLKGGLLVDNLYRFCQQLLVGVACWLGAKMLDKDGTASFGFIFLIIMVSYMMSTFALVLLRHINTMSMYGPILSLMSFVILIPMVVFQTLYGITGMEKISIVPIAALVLTVIFSGLAAWLSVANVLSNYDKSFGGR